MKFIFIFTLLSITSTAFGRAHNNHCEFYVKVDKLFGCSQDPEDKDQYLLKYGYRMCQKYSEKQVDWPRPLQNFITGVAACLQNKVAEYFDTEVSCKSLGKIAFASHYECYLRSGFCDLSLQSRIKVFTVALEPNLIFNGTWNLGYRLWQECYQ